MHFFVKRIFFGLIIVSIIYSRLVGIDWGLPYPMHPDERNMSSAIQGLNCEIQNSTLKAQNCFNPKFFAYGQLPLYGGYAIVKSYHLIKYQDFNQTISFEEATIALRLISAFSSLLVLFILYRIIAVFFFKKMSYFESVITVLTLSFVPYAIQFAHFGTTESLLMMLYSLVLYFTLGGIFSTKNKRSIFYSGLLCGVAVGVKLSSAIFVFLPAIAVFVTLFNNRKKGWRQTLRYIFSVKLILIISFIVGYFVSSPHNIISWGEFVGSIGYESAVALGKAEVFYTRQFFASLPYYFQFVRVFPYTIGGAGLVLFILGFIILSEKGVKWWLIRLAFIVPFLISGLMFAKWSRFLAICYPVMSLIIGISVVRFYRFLTLNWQAGSKLISGIVVLILILPGVAYLSIYTSEDVRFTVSRWIQENIPDKTTILSETANVVDIPVIVPSSEYQVPGYTELRTKNYKLGTTYNPISFDFYNVDTNPQLATDLQKNIATLDYVFVPSRRVFANHTCVVPSTERKQEILDFFSYKTSRCKDLEKRYPILNAYYRSLFDESKYQQVAKFTSYPRISLLGKTLIEFPDEMSEETWTVFDHPVIRVYKKIN